MVRERRRTSHVSSWSRKIRFYFIYFVKKIIWHHRMRGTLTGERVFSECFLLELFVFWLSIVRVNKTGTSALENLHDHLHEDAS